MMHENVDFVHLLFLSFADKLNTKTIVCMGIVHISNDCSATGHLPFLVSGGVRATTGELRPRNLLETVFKDASHTRLSTSGASVQLFRVWHV